MSLQGVPVLVTGADGFIGSHLVERLVAEGARRPRVLPLQLARLGRLARRGRRRDVRAALDVRLGDIRDARVRRATRRTGVEVVFHLAALIAIPYSYVAAESFVDTNVRGTLNVLEAARRAGVRRVIATSTSEVYGTPDDPADPRDAPAQGPVAVRRDQGRRRPAGARVPPQLRAAGRRSCARSTPTARASPSAPSCRRCSASCSPGAREIQLGRLDTRRDLTFVADTVDGFVRAATAPGHRGPDDPARHRPDRDRSASCSTIARRLTGSDAVAVEDAGPPPAGRAARSWCCSSDPTRARELLGWEATHEPRGRARATIEWIRASPAPPTDVDRVQL